MITPGPWEFQKHGKESRFFGNILGKYPDGSIRTITCQLRYGSEEEQEANARSIALVPEMLEIVKMVSSQTCLCGSGFYCVCCKAEALLFKLPTPRGSEGK